MSNLKGKVSLLLALVMMMMTILPIANVFAGTEYYPVYVTIKDANGKELKAGTVYTDIKAGDKITVTASCPAEQSVYWSQNAYYMNEHGYKVNDKGMALLGYVWDDEDVSKTRSSDDPTKMVVTIPDSFKVGTTHILAVQGVGAIDYYTLNGTTYEATSGWIEIKFKVAEASSASVDEELVVEPWMKENKGLENLSVSLRCEAEEEKANNNIYALNEKVTYYVDYKNGDEDITKNVKLVLELPLDATVVDACGGTVSGKTVTWEFPEGLEKGQEGTKTVVVRYTSLGKSSVKSKLVYPVANIYEGKNIADSSSVINLIFKDTKTEIVDEEHYPYMHGDAEADTFRPDDGITRAEGALVLTRIFGMNTSGVTITNLYPDLGETYVEAQKAIVAATKAGLINGYTDGTYRPNEKMTRAEFMKIIAANVELAAKENDDLEDEVIEGLRVRTSDEAIKIYKNPTKSYVVNGSNVSEHWASPYVTLLARLNMTDLTSKNKDLRLDEEITRAEVAQLVNFYLFRAPADVNSKTKSGFSDVNKKHKLFADIIEATRPAHTYTLTLEGTEVAVED